MLFAALHATPFSNYYGVFVWAGRFDDAANGFGLQHTWDGESFFKRFAVDHVLVRGYMRVNRYEVLHIPGAEHLPIVTEIETPIEVKVPWKMPDPE